MKNQRDIRCLADSIERVEADLRNRFSLVNTMCSADRDRERIASGCLCKCLCGFSSGVKGLCVILIEVAGYMADLSFNSDIAGMSILNYLAGGLNVLFEALHGSIDHDGSKAEVDRFLAGLIALAVVKVKNDRYADLFSILFADKCCVLKIDIVAEVALSETDDQRKAKLLGEKYMVFDTFHINEVCGRYCIVLSLRFFEHFSGIYKHFDFLLGVMNKVCIRIAAAGIKPAA